MMKTLLSTLGTKAHVRLIDQITMLPVIDHRIQDLGVTTTFIYLRMHLFIYHISIMFFDPTIRKLNIISQSVEEGIMIT